MTNQARLMLQPALRTEIADDNEARCRPAPVLRGTSQNDVRQRGYGSLVALDSSRSTLSRGTDGDQRNQQLGCMTRVQIGGVFVA
jgi:hypothetical protein